MRFSDGSSDVCSSELGVRPACCRNQPVNVDGVLPPIDPPVFRRAFSRPARIALILLEARWRAGGERGERARHHLAQRSHVPRIKAGSSFIRRDVEKSLLQYGAAIDAVRSEEHTSELQSLMRISYAVCCLNKKKHNHNIQITQL